MLRSLTDRLRIYISDRRIVLVHESGLLHRKTIKTHQFSLESTRTESSTNVVNILNDILLNPEFKGINVRLILSGHFFKYRIASWNDDLTTDDQLTLLMHQFEDVYGDQATQWKIFISNTGFRKNELACAIDDHFLGMLQALFHDKSRRLISIEPSLTLVFNLFRKQMKWAGTLILVETGQVCFTHYSETGWNRVQTKHIEEPYSQLAILLQREFLQSGEFDPALPIYFFWPDNPEYQLTVPGFENIHKLSLAAGPDLFVLNAAELMAAV